MEFYIKHASSEKGAFKVHTNNRDPDQSAGQHSLIWDIDKYSRVFSDYVSR